MIYFDNSASTLIKPKQVQKAMLDALSFFTANPGRSGHREAIKTAMEIEKVRDKASAHVNGDIAIFTGGCTHALNLGILGYVKSGHVVCTENEHNSALRPLQFLHDKYGVDFDVVKQTKKGSLSFDDIKPYLRPDTKLVITNHISNVNGDVADISDIGKKLKERKITYLVDGAQGGGHFKYDMKEMNIDMLALAPHKGFYSPQGVGCLVINGDINLDPILFGGTGTNSLELYQPLSLPERLESGTLNTPNIIAFGAGIDFVEENFIEINEKMDDLTTFLHYELSKLPVQIYTSTENTNGVFAFNIEGFNSSDLATILNDKYGICVSGGYHCAPKKHEALGTIENGLVRVSFSYFNTLQEVERLILAVKHILIKNKNLKN